MIKLRIRELLMDPGKGDSGLLYSSVKVGVIDDEVDEGIGIAFIGVWPAGFKE